MAQQPRRHKQPKGHSKTYLSRYDKKWHTWVRIGTKQNGEPLRRNVRGETATESAELADALKERIKRGAGIPAKIETVEQWLTHWVHKIVREELAWKTFQGYEIAVRRHIIPNIGAWKLDGLERRLEPEHVRAMYKSLEGKIAASYIRQVHWILSEALQQAVVEGKAARNVCTMIKSPKVAKGSKRKIKGLGLDVVQAIVQAALDDPMCERWLIGMLLGARQGEALALRWNVVHLDDGQAPYLEITEQLQRRTWEHGCDDAAACVRQLSAAKKRKRPLCRTTACPPKYSHGCRQATACAKLAHFCPLRKVVPGECARHLSANPAKKVKCPPVCEPDCTGHASLCDQRINGGMVVTGVKSDSGERVLPLFVFVAERLRLRREDQIRKDLFTPDGLVFCGPGGERIDSRRDLEAWKRLLVKAKVADSRLHAARHTACSLLLTQADISVVREIMGHGDIRQTQEYTDVAKEIKANAVNNLAAAIMGGDLARLLQPKTATNAITGA